ncbi:MAG: MlaD family protein, partial [Stenotrophomonas maltophilia]|nr:MlaD family protein [Stenotrophomonas maltophilia]
MDFDLKDVLELLQTVARSIGAEVTSPWFYLQLGLVLSGAGIAFATSAAVRARIDVTSLALGWPGPLRQLLRVLLESVTTVVFVILMRIARTGSQFWVVKPELGLMKTANLETLVTGQYIEVLPAVKSTGAQKNFVALAQPPEANVQEAGLSLVLSAARRGSLKVGVPVTYREVTVGKVTGYELGKTADRVLIHVLIEPKYAPLVRGGSRFWNSSGFGLDFGL